jgi:uncharacterized protein (TIGR03437 family)
MMEVRESPVITLGLVSLALVLAAVPAAAQTLSAQPSAVIFQYNVNQQYPEPVQVAISASEGGISNLAASVVPGSGTPSGLFQVTVLTPAVSVGLDRGTLSTILGQPGIYTASIQVTASGFAPLTVPVTLNLGVGAPSVQAVPASLIFNMLAGASSQTVSLTATSGTAVSFTVAATTTTGGNWLAATANLTYTPAVLTVSVNPGSLASGTYTGSVTVTPSSGSALDIPVTLQAGPSAALTINPASLFFSYTAGGAAPAAQALHVTSNIPGNSFTASATSTGGWLLVNGVTGPVSGSLPEDLNVTVSPAGLGGGSYQGTITVHSADGSQQVIPVNLTVNGGVSPIANPTSLAFVAEAGGAAPAQQFVVFSAPPHTNFTAAVTSGGGWLSISQTSGLAPAQISVTATPGSLAAGSYSGSIAVTVGSQAQTIQVSLVVSANPVLTTNIGAYVLYYLGGYPAPAPFTVNVDVSSGGQQGFTVSTGQPSWLQVPTGGTTPINLTVTLNPTSLASGTYLAPLVLTPTASGGVPLTVPILVVVSGATPIVSGATSLTFNGITGGAAQTQTLQVTASSPTAFTAGVTTASGGDWLSISPAGGTASVAATPLTVTANPAKLGSGTYQGTISLTTNIGVLTQVPVTFNVAAGGGISVSPATLAFDYTQGGALPATQAIAVSGSQNFTAAAHTNDGGTWLSVTPASGSGNANLTVTADPTGLAAGAYGGSITVTPASGAAQTVIVTLNVTAVAGLTVAPNSLAFAYRTGDALPAAQTLAVSALGPATTFTTAATSSGWLSVTPQTGTTPATLTVSVDPASLGAGSYTGSIVVSGESGTPVTVPVTLSVTAPLPVISRVVNAASYLGGGISPGEIVVLFGDFLGPSTGKSGAPNSSGFFETSLANVVVTFNGYPAPLLYASAGQVNAIVPYEVAGMPNALVGLSFGKAKSNTVTLPVVSSAPGIFSADASGTGPGAILDLNYHLVSASNPVSPGAIIQIYATGEGQTTPPGIDGKVTALAPPFPYPNLAPAVVIGGLPAEILYIGAAPGLVAGALQVNVRIPDGVPSGTVPLVLRIGDNSSQPGITVAVQ